MTAVNKIYQQVLVPVLWRENLVCSSTRIFPSAIRILYYKILHKLEVREDLATQQQFCQTET